MSHCISFDTETTGFDLRGKHKVFAYSVGHNDHGRAKTSVHRLDGDKLRQVQSRQNLERIWRDTSITKVMHNAKFDLCGTEQLLGRKLAEEHPFHDTMLMSHMLQNNHPGHGLKGLAWELAGISVDDETTLRGFVGEHGNYQDNVPEHVMDEYQHKDALRTLLLFEFFWPKIQADPGVLSNYLVERELVTTTLRIEDRGVMLNPDRTREMIHRLEQEAAEVRQDIIRIVGRHINPGSDDQLRALLFDELKMPVLALTDKARQPAVDKETLKALQVTNPHPVLQQVIRYRSRRLGASTLQGYLRFADDQNIIHPNIKTCGATTDRESCSRPNLQNVAKSEVLLNPYPVPARQCFRPRPGYINIHIDYSGIELRLLVHYAKEPELVRVLRERGDPHGPAFETFFPHEFIHAIGKVRDTFRSATKNMNFAIPYGAAGPAVAIGLGLALEIGLARYRDYRLRFARLVALNKLIGDQVRSVGYVTTAFDRRLYLSRDKAYAALNALIQGTGAQILKRAQNRVHKYLAMATSGEVGIILPIHDELVLEYPRARLGDLKPTLRDISGLMTDFPMFDVPLEVGIELATLDWDHTKEFKLEKASA